MIFKRKIRKKVYSLYLKGVCINFIANELNMDFVDVNEIIDYMNEIYM